jgi:hypothetical protein
MVTHRRSTPVVPVLLVTLLALGGCASSETTPSSSATTGDVKSRDTTECMNLAREVRSGPQGPRTTINQDRYQQCMRERGHMSAPTK